MKTPKARLIAGAALLLLAAVVGAAEVTYDARPIESERRAKDTYFRDDPWSPLRAFARYDFPRGVGAAAAVGSDAGADVRLPAADVAPRQLRMTVMAPETGGGEYRFRLESLDQKRNVLAGGEPLGGERVVPEETRIEIGPYALRPYVQDDTGILILFDSRRTQGSRFEAPHYFAIDATLRFRAPLHRYEQPATVSLATSLGRTKTYLKVGYFDLPLRQPPVRVYVYQPTFESRPEELLSILFTDRTTGHETYAAGRYLDLGPPVDGLYTLDFNRAYNPFCAYTDVYNCPIPPVENRLPVPVRAGEKTYPKHASGAADQSRDQRTTG